MKSISYKELSNILTQKSRGAVSKLINDSEVHYLIVLQASADSKPKILPAGPTLDFRKPKDAAGQVIRGMRAVAYVDLKAQPAEEAPTNTKTATKPAGAETQKLREMKAKLVWYENECDKHQKQIRKAKRILKEKDIKIAELAKRNEMLSARMDEFSCSDDQAEEKRLADIEKAENELIDRMNELMRKEAEIEQREEDLLGNENTTFN